ncbi:hypothetical protein [Nakamurella sp. PAMC28650]|uniref:hypothetical protein n=1 Tax=Nakamurella sp. PAMC28650 TaxID=2762325 RepID=UPI00164D5BFD|nr:hypothetical protein [Nakamurella sp. PAMC28650]QNK80755.1 hypothetical protein H7F38_22010 [Nakamurella sp. PAMC28650]
MAGFLAAGTGLSHGGEKPHIVIYLHWDHLTGEIAKATRESGFPMSTARTNAAWINFALLGRVGQKSSLSSIPAKLIHARRCLPTPGAGLVAALGSFAAEARVRLAAQRTSNRRARALERAQRDLGLRPVPRS